MLNKNKTNWSLLAKYLAGETDARETTEITAWIDRSPENRTLFQEIKSDWKKMDRIETKFDVDSAWNKLHQRITSNQPATEEMQAVGKSRNRMPVIYRLAAALVILTALGAVYYLFADRMQNIQVIASAQEKGKRVELPDGSVVYLNASTEFSYPRHFGQHTREVKLNGEAFFEVQPDKEKPFRVHAGRANVRVLGTSFNVNTRRGNDQVEVYVSTGMVELSEASDESNKVLLKPGNIGRMNNKTMQKLQAENQNPIAWKTGNLTFRDTPLYEVTRLLNTVYQVNIELKGDGLDTIGINGSYQGDPLEVILNVICQQNHLTIAKSDDTIYLSR